MAITRDARRAYVLCELDESLITLDRAGLGWEVIDVRAGFDMGSGEAGAGAAIRLSPDERHVYLSSRRLSSIACFATGSTPRSVGKVASGGDTPREFIVTSDGGWVISANQIGNSLSSLRRDADTGTLEASGHECRIGSPVALFELS